MERLERKIRGKIKKKTFCISLVNYLDNWIAFVDYK